MKVLLAEPSGACYGVNRALNLAHEAADAANGRTVHTLGPLIHNPKVVDELAFKGVLVARTADEAEDGLLVIRSHGVPSGLIENARSRGLVVVDATCPHVKRAQEESARLAAEGRYVLILGEPGHPEVEAIFSYAGDAACVVEGVDDVPELDADTPVGVVVQTTQRPEKLAALSDKLSARFSNLEVCHTICAATQKRQDAAKQLSAEVDSMVVIGGRNSGNTTRLYEICIEACPKTFHIESACELDREWFAGCDVVGVTAGASTPRSHIDAVVEVLEGF